MRMLMMFSLIIVTILMSCRPRNNNGGAGLASSDDDEIPLNPLFERYEGDKETEAGLIRDLANKFAQSQAGIGSGMPDKQDIRGTHAKGSCIDGSLTLEPQSDAFYKKGPFGDGMTVDTRIRFANASSQIQADTAPDVRAVSFSFMAKGKRYDFSMNNDPAFTFESLKDFNNFMAYVLKAGNLRNLVAKGLVAPDQVPVQLKAFTDANPDLLASLGRVLAVGNVQQGKKVYSYATENYGTGSAMLFGQDHAAKFTLTQCSKAEPRREVPANAGSDYLQESLRNTVVNNPETICFDFNVEILDAQAMNAKSGKTLNAWDWVENTTLDWTAAGAKSHKLGKLVAKPNSFKTKNQCDDVSNAYNMNKYTHPDIRPIGRINRARAAAEAQSQKMR